MFINMEPWGTPTFIVFHSEFHPFHPLGGQESGFIFGDSTINQLVNISNDFGRVLDSGKEIRVVFCDISKAFDRAWHKGLLFKLIVSSANNLILALISVTISFMNNKNRRGPNMEPWGTPAFIVFRYF
jgi:hypothetical protein